MAIRCKNVQVQLQAGSDRTLYATWTCTANIPRSTTTAISKYKYIWQYNTGQGTWFNNSYEETTGKFENCTYSAPSNAAQVRFRVKAISKYKNSKKKTYYWTDSYTEWVTYDFSVTPQSPAVPDTPEVTLTDFTLKAEIDNITDPNTNAIFFEVVRDDASTFTSGRSTISTGHAAFSCSVAAGSRYKVRAKGLKLGDDDVVISESDWSNYSANYDTIPAAPTWSEESASVTNKTQINFNWEAVPTATGYTIEYTTDKTYFDVSSEVQSQEFSTNTAIINGLSTGNIWYFRLRAKNGAGDSGWSEIIAVTIGKVPAAPTTWASTSTATVGDPVILYWVHNSQDGSKQKYAQIELTINGTTTVIDKDYSEEGEDVEEITKQHTFDTSGYVEGSILTWRVRTKGVMDSPNDGYGEWSTLRQVTIYAPPTVIFDTGTIIPSVFESFPLVANLTAGPAIQNAVMFNITIITNEAYQTEDYAGRDIWVNANDIVFSKSYAPDGNSLEVEIGPGDVRLENEITYTFTATVFMDSGLTATASREFVVSWAEEDVFLDAEIGADLDSLAAFIRPYVYIETEIDNVTEYVEQSGYILSVFRREFDGSFYPVAENIDSDDGITVTDPHPALDEARYRVSATNKTTGQVIFYDIPGYPIGEPSIIIQWDESWRNYGMEIDDVDDDPVNPETIGSMLKLPYNIDVQDKYSPDVTYANYIGREHPVSYYGTQQGHKATWTTEIPADDVDTIYALRRLAVYKGDVYVREPSGTGYWANVNVSFSLKHLAVTVPITFDITRVDGSKNIKTTE